MKTYIMTTRKKWPESRCTPYVIFYPLAIEANLLAHFVHVNFAYVQRQIANILRHFEPGVERT
jgi:hypothetical protein